MKNIVRYIFLFIGFSCQAQERMLLYPGPIPNAKIVENKEWEQANELVDSLTYAITVPSLTVFLPKKELANGTAVIICPGGGYGVLLTKREGTDVARAFNKLGVAAFVLRYRIPNDQTMLDKTIGPMQDAQQAIKLVRENAEKWNIESNKIGIMGFSAGGHLASIAGVHFDIPKIPNDQGTSLRPDFMLLINPVITFTETNGHLGSRDNLLGVQAKKETIHFFSSELNVTPSTPPAFLVHAAPDSVVPVENSIHFFQALQKNKVPAGLHIYPKGEHGFLTAPVFKEWFGRCVDWMKSFSLLDH